MRDCGGRCRCFSWCRARRRCGSWRRSWSGGGRRSRSRSRCWCRSWSSGRGSLGNCEYLVGLYTDRKPQPYSLMVGMGFTLVGLLLSGLGWIDGLRKGFGDRLLIDNLSFSLPRGGIVGINIGANKDSSDRVADYRAAFARLALYGRIDHVQVSWVKLGDRLQRVHSAVALALPRAGPQAGRVQGAMIRGVLPKIASTALNSRVARPALRPARRLPDRPGLLARPDGWHRPGRRQQRAATREQRLRLEVPSPRNRGTGRQLRVEVGREEGGRAELPHRLRGGGRVRRAARARRAGAA